MQVLNRVLGILERIFVFAAGVGLILMMLLTTFDLLSRKFLDFSIPSLYEFTEDYLMVSLVFLTLSYVYLVGGHVRVTLFEKFIPRRVNAVWQRIHKAMTLVLFALIAVKGWEAAVEAYRFNEMSNSLLAYPLAPALMMVPIGSAMLCLRILQSLLDGSTQEDSHEMPIVD
ncbi:MAG: TRAP transporter small permease [Gemmatimonadales bacterium]|nr:TRAP transporter small permease [Gemmatimonadales bacterium]